jgi:hypothetical protein
VFIGGGDGYLHAFDERTSKEAWRGKVPYENAAVPMTYRTRTGRQFVILATGTGLENALVAFALGNNQQENMLFRRERNLSRAACAHSSVTVKYRSTASFAGSNGCGSPGLRS